MIGQGQISDAETVAALMLALTHLGRVPERRTGQPIEWPVARRFSQASTTRAAMPASAALPQARGS